MVGDVRISLAGHLFLSNVAFVPCQDQTSTPGQRRQTPAGGRDRIHRLTESGWMCLYSVNAHHHRDERVSYIKADEHSRRLPTKAGTRGATVCRISRRSRLYFMRKGGAKSSSFFALASTRANRIWGCWVGGIYSSVACHGCWVIAHAPSGGRSYRAGHRNTPIYRQVLCESTQKRSIRLLRHSSRPSIFRDTRSRLAINIDR